mgnify:CR=1 FL=1
MNTQMGSALPTEKLDRNNLNCILGIQDAPIPCRPRLLELCRRSTRKSTNPTHVNHPAWEQTVSPVLYFVASCIHDHMLSYIREARMPKEAWGNLKKIFVPNTTARKLQLRQELNIYQRDICQSTPTLRRSMSRVIPLGRSMLLTTTKWRRYALAA